MNQERAFWFFLILFAFGSLNAFVMFATHTSVSEAPRKSAHALPTKAAPEEPACRETREIAITSRDPLALQLEVGPRPPVCIRISSEASVPMHDELVAVAVWVIQTAPSASWLLAGFPLEETQINVTLPRQYVGAFKTDDLPQTFALRSQPGDLLPVRVTAFPIFRSPPDLYQATIAPAPALP